MSADDVPARVLEAESRRAFRDRLSRGSLGCPLAWPGCGHLLSQHAVSDWDNAGAPVDPLCLVPGCDCGVVVVTARPRAYVIPKQDVVWVPLLQLPWRDDKKDLKR